jgi:hypothetical protein
VDGLFWKSYIRQELGGELYLMMLIGGVEERAAIQLEMRERGDENIFKGGGDTPAMKT